MIFWDNFEILLEVFIPNTPGNHCITYTNCHVGKGHIRLLAVPFQSVEGESESRIQVRRDCVTYTTNYIEFFSFPMYIFRLFAVFVAISKFTTIYYVCSLFSSQLASLYHMLLNLIVTR